jgi:ComF family protein
MKSIPQLAPHLRKLIASSYGRLPFPPDVVIPIPLSRMRHLERGFNQAETVGKEVARQLNVAFDPFSLVRTSHSPIHRVGMDAKARDLTVKNSFQVKRGNLIKGKNVLLVDDVMTSGATASHCARVLKKSGAASVVVFTVARAVMRKY